MTVFYIIKLEATRSSRGCAWRSVSCSFAGLLSTNTVTMKNKTKPKHIKLPHFSPTQTSCIITIFSPRRWFLWIPWQQACAVYFFCVVWHAVPVCVRPLSRPVVRDIVSLLGVGYCCSTHVRATARRVNSEPKRSENWCILHFLKPSIDGFQYEVHVGLCQYFLFLTSYRVSSVWKQTIKAPIS